MVTLAQLKERARQRSDMENSNFVSDAELTSYINSSVAELHDLLIGAYGEDYFLSEDTFSTVAGTADYALPDDFYKLRGVDISLNGSDYITAKKFNFNERNRNTDVTWGTRSAPHFRYRLMGSNIKFSPVPQSAASIKIWYVPTATALTVDADQYDDLNQYSEYVVVDAAIKMLQKEESDVTVLMNQKMALKRRLEEMANNRDIGQPESVRDIYSENDELWNE